MQRLVSASLYRELISHRGGCQLAALAVTLSGAIRCVEVKPEAGATQCC